MKKALALLLAVILTAGLFTSCRKNKLTALYFAVDGAAGSFDPQIAASSAVRIVVRNCFEGLVSVDPSGQILPAAMRFAVKEAGRKISGRIAENESRAAENGASPSGASLPVSDVKSLSKAQRLDIIRRVGKGEKISF